MLLFFFLSNIKASVRVGGEEEIQKYISASYTAAKTDLRTIQYCLSDAPAEQKNGWRAQERSQNYPNARGCKMLCRRSNTIKSHN